MTLYGQDPDERPDIYGKVGTSGVSVCTLDDMKVLYDGFELCAPTTSVSMTINGPAPIILAMFLNTAIDQQVDKYLAESAANHALWRLLNEEPLEYAVAGDLDDSEQNSTYGEPYGPELELGQRRYVGLRFRDVAIPQGETAKMTSATTAK